MATPHSPITSRFQVLDSPILSPGKCCMCGAHSRPVVDTSLELNVEGYAFRVYICVLCLLDASEQVKKYQVTTGELESEADSVNTYLAQHNLKVISDELYDSLVFWITGLSSAIDIVSADPHNVEEGPEGESGDNPEDAQFDAGDSEDSVGDLFSLDPGKPETSSKPRSADLFSLDSDG